MDCEKPYEFKREAGKVFLRVFNADINPHMILESLINEGTGVSLQQVEEIISEASGEWVQMAGENDRTIKIRITPDRMKAQISLNLAEGGTMPEIKHFREAFEEAGVILGIDEGLLNRIIQKKQVLNGKWIEIARGEPAKDGIDASLEVLVDTDRKGPVNSNEAAQIDLKDLGIINDVRENQLIVIKTPLQEGIDGKDVTGKIIKARKAKDVSIKPGPNTSLSGNGLELTATVGGHLVREGTRFSVERVFKVNGDVDYSTGNLESSGSIVVTGSVKDDFCINVQENLEIRGVVEGAHLSSGKDMALRSSVRGMGKGLIESGNHLNAEYIDQCSLKIGGNLLFKGALMHCEVETEGAIRSLEGGKGLIAGGTLRAGTEIECSILGTRMGTKTFLHVGVSPKLIAQKKELQGKKEELQAKGKTLEKNIQYLSKTLQEKGLSSDQKIMAAKFLELLPVLREQLARIEELQMEIEEVIDRAKLKGTVKVRGICYPGVAVSIRQNTLLVRETLEDVRFIYENGRVKIVSLEE